jgi:hypothetical protein
VNVALTTGEPSVRGIVSLARDPLVRHAEATHLERRFELSLFGQVLATDGRHPHLPDR